MLFWEEGTQESDADRLRATEPVALLSGLKGTTMYLISVRAQNSAGVGPSSLAVNVTTKKPREYNFQRPIFTFSSLAILVSQEGLEYSLEQRLLSVCLA